MKGATRLTILGFAVALCCAGAEYHYGCATPGCALRSESLFGGPLLQIGFYDYEGHISGYCYHCEKFVTIRWKSTAIPKDVSTNLPYAPPEKLATVWMPFTTKSFNLYSCPECNCPFSEIDEASIQESDGRKCIFCPRCNNRSLRLWDPLRIP